MPRLWFRAYTGNDVIDTPYAPNLLPTLDCGMLNDAFYVGADYRYVDERPARSSRFLHIRLLISRLGIQ